MQDVDRGQPERFDEPAKPQSGRGPGLEGRLTSQYERRYDDDSFSRREWSISPRHRERDSDERVHRRDDWEFHGTHDGRTDRWDWSNSEHPSPPPSLSFDPDATRFVYMYPADSHTSHGKNVRNKRSFSDDADIAISSKDTNRPRSPVINGLDHDAYASHFRQGNDRPSNSRGGSLLDRLSNDSVRGGEALVETSYRRHDDPPRRSSDERMGNGDNSVDQDYGERYDGRDRGQDLSSKAARNRRRGGKPRRVRKSGQ